MKSITIASLLCITFLSITCKKHDYCPEPFKKDSTCDLVQSTLFRDASSGDESGLFSEYRKEYDNTGKVHKVIAGVYTLRLDDSVALLLTYKGSTVYFIDEAKPTDTILIATFDSQNRLQKMATGNATISDFETTVFAYESGHLSSYLIRDLFLYHITYDENGNVARIYGNTDNANGGLFFTYDLTVQAKRQWYTDHFPLLGVNNGLYLAQFMGWLPDLEPPNKRTSWKYVFNDDDDDSTPPVVIERTLTNHFYDSNGNLVSYSDGDIFTNIYNCSAQKNDTTN